MAKNRKNELEANEILRVIVTKKHPDATDYEYEMDVVTNDEDAVRLSEVFEKALDKEIDLSVLLKVLEKAIEEGIDLSSILEDNT